jgi:hypothetical protein
MSENSDRQNTELLGRIQELDQTLLASEKSLRDRAELILQSVDLVELISSYPLIPKVIRDELENLPFQILLESESITETERALKSRAAELKKSIKETILNQVPEGATIDDGVLNNMVESALAKSHENIRKKKAASRRLTERNVELHTQTAHFREIDAWVDSISSVKEALKKIAGDIEIVESESLSRSEYLDSVGLLEEEIKSTKMEDEKTRLEQLLSTAESRARSFE